MGEIRPLSSRQSRIWLVTGIVLGAILIDQAIKIYIATHFAVGESHEVCSWFWLCYVENNGMAFGIEWFSKFALTFFRVIAVGLLGWYIDRLMRKPEVPTGYIATISFIIAGALGNIIDCVCYGKIFQDTGWFLGKVVDMFYFPLIHNSDGEVLFFRPVFNFADSCITVSVFVILIFYWKQVNGQETR